MRLIDADAFKDYIRNALEETKHIYKDNGAWAKEITESFCKDIDEQPTIHPEPHWIPVTERLPKESGLYQVTDMQGNVVRYVFGEGSEEYWRRCVKAWMPLPEPYKGATK